MDYNTEAIITMKSLRRKNQQHQHQDHLRRVPSFNSGPSDRAQRFSCPPPKKRAKTCSNNRDKSLTPRKSNRPVTEGADTDLKLSGQEPLGPDPSDLPKNISRAILTFSSSSSSSSSSPSGQSSHMASRDNIFSGSVSTIAPPPSSLPLPKFDVRPKLSCKAEASTGEIDIGATDNLRRLLRLQ